MIEIDSLDDVNLDAAGGAFAEPLDNPENTTPHGPEALETLTMSTFLRTHFQRDQGAGFASWCRATGCATPAARETWLQRVATFSGRTIG